MWTCTLILLENHPSTPIIKIGLYRGEEVILGALVGGALHTGCEWLLKRLLLAKETKETTPGVNLAESSACYAQSGTMHASGPAFEGQGVGSD